MLDIKIVSAEISDSKILHNIAVTAFRDIYEKYRHYPPGIACLDWHKEKIKDEDEIYYKILKDKIIIGGIYLINQPNQVMNFDFLFINKEFQGKGVGSYIIKSIELRHKNIKKWECVTAYKSFEIHRFIEKYGYRKIREFKPVENGENREFKLFQYEKIIY